MVRLTLIILALAAASHATFFRNPKPVIYMKKAMCSSDNMMTVKNGYMAYLMNFGLNVGTDYMTYENTRSNMIMGAGKNAQISICNWFRTLQSALMGIDTQDTCMNIETMSQVLMVNMTDGDNYMTDYFRMQYECGEGYDVLINNFDCFMAVAQFHMDELQKCGNDFYSATNGTSDMGVICKAFNDYITCEGMIYNHYCNSQASQWVCKVNEISLKVNTNQCDNILQQC